MAALSRARPTADWRSGGRSSKWTSAAVVVVLHVALVVVLLQFESVRTAVTAAAPVMATLISPPREKPEVLPKPPPPPPKPQVRHKPQPAPQPPVITAQPEAPSTYTAPPAPPTPVPIPPVEVPVAPAPEPAPAPVIPPSFNAAYLNNPAPAYPLTSREMGEEGRVVLRVFVNERGQPEELQVRTSSGFSRLDDAARDTVRKWKFVPAKRGDTAVGAWVLVPISFNLRS
jgi:protein TonB